MGFFFFVSRNLSISGGFGLFHSFWNVRSHSFKWLDILGFLIILFLDWFQQKVDLLHTLNLSVDWPLSSKYLYEFSEIQFLKTAAWLQFSDFVYPND